MTSNGRAQPTIWTVSAILAVVPAGLLQPPEAFLGDPRDADPPSCPALEPILTDIYRNLSGRRDRSASLVDLDEGIQE